MSTCWAGSNPVARLMAWASSATSSAALPRAESGLGRATGLGNDKAQVLMKILARIVLAYLRKRMFGGGVA